MRAVCGSAFSPQQVTTIGRICVILNEAYRHGYAAYRVLPPTGNRAEGGTRPEAAIGGVRAVVGSVDGIRLFCGQVRV